MGGGTSKSCPSDNVATLSDSNVITSAVFSVLSLIYVVVLIGYYIYKRNEIKEEKRKDELLAFISIIGITFSWTLNLRDVVGRDVFPCFLFWSYTPLLFAWGFVPIALRVVLFYNRVVFSNNLAEQTFIESVEAHTTTEGSAVESVDVDESLVLARISRPRNQNNLSTSLGSGAVSTEWQSTTSGSSPMLSSQFTPQLRRLKFYASPKFGVILAIFIGVLTTLVYTASATHTLGCGGCDRLPFFVYGIAVFLGSILAFICSLVFWRLRHEPDPLRTRRQVMSEIIIVLSGTTIWFFIAAIDFNDAFADGVFNYWNLMVFFYAPAMAIMLFPSIVASSSLTRNMYGADDAKTLDEVLESKTGRQLFKTHMVNELSIENYYFWREVTAWKKNYSRNSERDRLFRFRFLVETFIESKSIMELNLSYEARDGVLRVLNGNDALDESVFDLCYNEVYQLMVNNSWPRFQQSALFDRLERGFEDGDMQLNAGIDNGIDL